MTSLPATPPPAESDTGRFSFKLQSDHEGETLKGQSVVASYFEISGFTFYLKILRAAWGRDVDRNWVNMSVMVMLFTQSQSQRIYFLFTFVQSS